MKTLKFIAASLLFTALASCSKSTIEKGSPQLSDMGDGGGASTSNSGVITASEWNDLNNWDFWNGLMNKSDNNSMQAKWGFFTKNRFSVKVTNQQMMPMIDVKVELLKNGQSVFTAKTDNMGKAELWANLITSGTEVDAAQYVISVNNNEKTLTNIKPFAQGLNTIVLDGNSSAANTANVCFVIDATSSMSDELKYLKNELYDVITRIKSNNPQTELYTSAVFYKDEGDDYITKKSDFSTDGSQTINFIKNEETNGGGDFPEAVHSSLDVTINNLSWSNSAKARIIFLLLDAPPHGEANVKASLQKSILKAAEKGIKLIPILASGADKDTEFSMRLMALATNGTFVFVTDDSKKGDKHYEPSVGDYHVEYLNNLMVRLVNANLN